MQTWTLRTLLLPLDGSALGARATEAVERLAHATGAHVLLLRAVPRVDPTSAHDPTSLALALEGQRQVWQTASTTLATEAARLRRGGIEAEALLRSGDAVEAIQAEADRADVIVMGTQARAGVERWLLGSVADRVVREGPVPVLVVPATCVALWPPARAPRILIPLDGSALAEAAMGPALVLARALGGELHLLRVVEPVADTHAAETTDRIRTAREGYAAARRSLKEAAARCAATDVRIHVHTTAGAPVPAAIRAFAREHQVDVLAMATHGRGGLLRMAMGSVATETVASSSLPVLLVRPGHHRGASAWRATAPVAL
jgi:nucleotide-binding universal stress UspA family protein